MFFLCFFNYIMSDDGLTVKPKPATHLLCDFVVMTDVIEYKREMKRWVFCNLHK